MVALVDAERQECTALLGIYRRLRSLKRARYAFSFPPQAAIINATPANTYIFCISLIVCREFVVIYLFQHLDFMHRLLYAGCVFGIDLTH